MNHPRTRALSYPPAAGTRLPRFARFLEAPADAPDSGAPAAGDSEPDGMGKASPWTPPASQDELDRIIGDRLARERAKYADYEDLKQKAAAFDKAEEDKKTAEERAADRLAAAEKRAAEAEAKAQAAEAAALCARVAADKGVPVGFLTGTEQAEIEKQAAALLDWKNGTAGGKGKPASGLGPGARNPRASGTTSGKSSGGMSAGRAWFTDRFSARGPQDS
ncbi:hypothetical protein NSA19_03775 [Actinomyces bowdenii]|uniref:hypothetical protein n=1 Tax=Actinomyces bowdenii TaxID=131109 RepID=UPI00214BE340|nr:hypothetical protein [Actinomyces bowdenii]MCR2051986.1 hypothetical protein [Actinomyces bowdenii]